MKEQKDIFNHLKKNSPSAPNIAYFENMATDIISQETKQTIVIPLYKKRTFWMTFAAASLALLVFLNMPSQKKEGVLISMNDFSISEIEGYINQNISDFDSELISDFIQEENIVEPTFDIEKEIVTIDIIDSELKLDDINTQEILDYFEAEEIDIYNENLELDYEELYI